jgi:hypothetical protein
MGPPNVGIAAVAVQATAARTVSVRLRFAEAVLLRTWNIDLVLRARDRVCGDGPDPTLCQGSRPSSRTSDFTRGESSVAVKAAPTARFAASDRVG